MQHVRTSETSSADGEQVNVSHFSDNSAFRLVHRQRFVALGGSRAVLLQGAHPLVMAGLVKHSDDLDRFRERLTRTAQIMEVIGFGSQRRAEELTGKIHDMHAKVRGGLDQPEGEFPAGSRYSALAPELQLWVLFTMFDSALLAHNKFVRPLSHAEQAAFWADWRFIGTLFGLRESSVPATLSEVNEYRREMLEGSTLRVTDDARRWIPPAVFNFDVPPAHRPLRAAFKFIGASLLPSRIRAEYGLDRFPSPVRRGFLGGLSRTVRAVRPLLPETVRISPDARGRLEEAVKPGTSDPGDSMADRLAMTVGR